MRVKQRPRRFARALQTRPREESAAVGPSLIGLGHVPWGNLTLRSGAYCKRVDFLNLLLMVSFTFYFLIVHS